MILSPAFKPFTISISTLDDKQCVNVGRFVLEWIHTPGHSPGGMCVKVSVGDSATSTAGSTAKPLLLLSGDTLFPGSCGRLDLPGADALVMYDSLAKLRSLPDELPVFPGHGYGGRHTTIGQEKRQGLLQPMSRDEWRRRMAR